MLLAIGHLFLGTWPAEPMKAATEEKLLQKPSGAAAAASRSRWRPATCASPSNGLQID